MKTTLDNPELFEPTLNLRIYRYITHAIWTTKCEDVYVDILQQAWFCKNTGKVEWRALEIVEEKSKNYIKYG